MRFVSSSLHVLRASDDRVFLSFLLLLHFFFFFSFDSLPALRHAEKSPRNERLSKSKIIPEQARALAHALKQAVVKPWKKALVKRKSSETSANEPSLEISTHRSSIPVDHLVHELSIDSNESTSPIPLTPPPAKPPRHADESDSSSSIDLPSLPPAKPPRHFSLYKNEHYEDLIQQTDQIVKRVLNLVESFGNAPPTSQPSESSETERDLSDPLIPVEITELATTLAERILDASQVEATLTATQTNKARQVRPMEEKRFRENLPLWSPSAVTMHVSPPPRQTERPLMFVSLDSKASKKKTLSPLLDIVTSKSTPSFTTSIRVSSASPSLVSSTTTITPSSDDECHSSSTLISKSSVTSTRSNVWRTQSEQGSRDSVNTNSSLLLRSTPDGILSDYDNLHGSSASLTEDSQSFYSALPSLSEVNSTSISTIYESLDYCPSSSTSPSYVSAASTFNRSGTTTPSRRDSNRTDEDLVDAFDLEGSSRGRTRARESTICTSEPSHGHKEIDPSPLACQFSLILPRVTTHGRSDLSRERACGLY